MTGKLHLIEGQAALIAPRADDAGSRESATVVFRVVGHIEVCVRVFLEALLAVPRHVLERRQRAVRREQEIEISDADEGVVDGFDDVGEHPVLRGAERSISQALIIGRATEDVGAGALLPVGAGGVDYFLDVAAVEVDDFEGRDVVAWVDAAALAPEVGAGVGDVVDVEAGVYE